jgi:curved DNA-binding protein
MAIEYKDYYKILGISQTATDDDIRKAFRKLARLYHPDVAKNSSTAEDKFKEVNEAYEVLSDPDKRRKYDDFGKYYTGSSSSSRSAGAWPPFANFTPGSRPGEFKFNGTGFSDFFEQLFGAMGSAKNGFRPTNGSGNGHGNGNGGQQAPFAQKPEAAAKGDDLEAELLVPLEEALHGAVRSITVRRLVRCSKCYGVGQLNGRRCEACHGSGNTERADTCKVKIPAGIQEGATLRVAGQGEPGSAGGLPGDLLLKVRFASHPNFHVRNGLLHHDLELAPWEAALGASLPVETLNGRVTIKIPPGTQNGAKLRIKGRGLPPALNADPGDLFVIVKIQIPKLANQKQQQLWEALARESNFNPRE